ncbi:condensation domain-containing protein [Vallitalea guaymasensis]|uniref:condensation domain-containing protein n=1 Tax=Vallitalea guaymasensis TaxID=1185412 RepID=UPI000DE4D3A1|nr:condensation domain-containing protein [Vallitalea guaymasensis]
MTLLLVLPFSHVIFDAMSSEILSRKLLEYYDALEKGEEISDEEVESYESYVDQIKNVGHSITEDDVIDIFELDEFEKYTSRMKCSSLEHSEARVTAFNYDISLKEIETTNYSIEPSKMSLDLISNVCQKYFGVPKVPMYMIGYGRKYEDKTYFNTIGEFIDLVPILVTDDGKSMEQAQDKLNKSSKYGINFFNLLYGNEISQDYKKIQHLMQKHDLKDSIIYNFQGKFEKEEDQLINELVLENNNNKMLGFVPRMQFNAKCYKDMLRITVFSSSPSEEEKIKELLNTELEHILESRIREIS